MENNTDLFLNTRDEYMILDSSYMFGTEGSGNQKKFWMGDTLIKLNSKYQEADKEVAASVIGKAFGLDMVEYTTGTYLFQDTIYKGCQCHSYLLPNEESYTLAHILQHIQFAVPATMSAIEYYRKVVDAITQYTHIPLADVDLYLMQLLVFDFLICNPDRHLGNIEFLLNTETKTSRAAPIFDCGQAFLHRSIMPSKRLLTQELYKFKALPFSRNPRSNLIDINKAKQIAKRYLANAGGIEGIQALNINGYFKYLVILRFKTLLNY